MLALEDYTKLRSRAIKVVESTWRKLCNSRKYIVIIKPLKGIEARIASSKITSYVLDVTGTPSHKQEFNVMIRSNNVILTTYTSLSNLINDYNKYFDQWFTELLSQITTRHLILTLTSTILILLGIMNIILSMLFSTSIATIIGDITPLAFGITLKIIDTKLNKSSDKAKLHRIMLCTCGVYKYYYDLIKANLKEVVMAAKSYLEDNVSNLCKKYDVIYEQKRGAILVQVVRKI